MKTLVKSTTRFLGSIAIVAVVTCTSVWSSKADERPARLDQHGDLLPPHAVARLGTTRFRHGDIVRFIRYIAEGKRIITHAEDGIRVWDAATGKQISAFRNNQTGFLGCLSADGKLFHCAGNDHSWQILELDTGKSLRTSSDKHAGLFFSPDSRQVAIVQIGSEPAIVLQDARTGRRIWTCPRDETRSTALAFTPDGKTLLIISANPEKPKTSGLLLYLDAATGREKKRIELAAPPLHQIAISSDGNCFAAICDGPEPVHLSHIRVWDLTTGTERVRFDPPMPKEEADAGAFSALTFSPDNRHLVTSADVDGLMVWRLADGKEHRRIGHGVKWSQDLTFSPDGKTIAAANFGSAIRLIDWNTGRNREFPTSGHEMFLTGTVFTPDGQTVATASDAEIIVWDWIPGRERKRFKLEDASFLNHVGLAPDGRTSFVTKSREKKLVLNDLVSHKPWLEHSATSSQGSARFLALSSGGKWLAVKGSSDRVHVIETATGKELQTLKDHGAVAAGVERARFTSDGSHLMVFYTDRTVRLWDVGTGAKSGQFGPMAEEPRLPNDTLYGYCYVAALSPDDRWVAYADYTECLRLLDAVSGQVLWNLDKLTGGPGALAFSPDSRTLAWGGVHDAAVHLVETMSGKERQKLSGHRGRIRSLMFSADGKRLVSGSDDTTALVWDLSSLVEARNGAISSADLDALWADLQSDDGGRAFRAIRNLATAPQASVPYLEKVLKPIVAADEGKVAQLIADLDSDSFDKRDAAFNALTKLGPSATSQCQRFLKGNPSPETRRRLERLIADVGQEAYWQSPEVWRSVRAVEALEAAGTQDARRLLAKLAAGAPAARLTQEAAASVQRALPSP